jgi:hypothetical protein
VAISVDATVARWSGTPDTGVFITSATFTPPDGSLLAVVSHADEPGQNATVVVSGSAGLTWTKRIERQNSDGQTGYVGIDTAPVVTGVSMVIDITRSGGAPFNGRAVSGKLFIITGQHASPIGTSNEASWTTDDQTVSVTTTGAGRLIGGGTRSDPSGTPTSTDEEDAAIVNGDTGCIAAYKASDHSGSTTQGINVNSDNANGNIVVLEILAAVTPPEGTRFLLTRF